MLVQNNVQKEHILFPVSNGVFDSENESDCNSNIEVYNGNNQEKRQNEQKIIAISFEPKKKNNSGIIIANNIINNSNIKIGETELSKENNNNNTNTNNNNKVIIEETLTKLFDQDETDLNLLLRKAISNNSDPNLNEEIKVHLQNLKKLGDELYNKIFDVDERTYLCYMTTTTENLSEIDGVILRHYYLEKFTWKSDLLSSLRILCSRLFFKGESQNIDIMIHSFANNWFSRYNHPSFIYGNIIGVYLVTYSLILLNTDLHNDHLISHLTPSSQRSLSTSSLKMSRRKSGSLFDLFSHDTSSSYIDNESEYRKSSIPYISKNQFVMNTIAALNDNFVIVNPLIMRKQLRLYYTNVKTHEILLPQSIDDKESLINSEFNNVENINNNINNNNNNEKFKTKANSSKYGEKIINNTTYKDIEEDPNDEVADLKSFHSSKSLNSLFSVASTRYSFELVSGTIKETIGPFGYLKEIEKIFSKQNLSYENINYSDNEKSTNNSILETPLIKEGIQKVLVNDLYKVFDDDDDYEKFSSNAFLFKVIPENKIIEFQIDKSDNNNNNSSNNLTIKKEKNKSKRKSLFKHLKFDKNKNKRANSKYINRESHNSKIIKKNEFKLTESFVVICDGELRLFEFDKNPNKVNSYSGHGRGEWTNWAKCLACVSLVGCYAELVGSSKRRESQEEKDQICNSFGTGIYWKLELPYSMMEMVNETPNSNINNTKNKFKNILSNNNTNTNNDKLKFPENEKFEKMIFKANTTETATEFINACNYWSGMKSKVPTISSQFFDDVNLTSFEYGFSPNIVNKILEISERLYKDGKKGNTDSKEQEKYNLSNKDRINLMNDLDKIIKNERKIAKWKPIVHSCKTVKEGNSCENQLREIDRYMNELSGVIIEQRNFLTNCRNVYNEIIIGTQPRLLKNDNSNLRKSILTVYNNHRSACVSLLRERRRWRVQRNIISQWQLEGQV